MDSELECYRLEFVLRLVTYRSIPMILDKPYQIATNFGIQKTQFQIWIRIENFPSFVSSNADYDTNGVIVNGTEWFIGMRLTKFCQNERKYIHITPSSSDQPKTLGACIFGTRSDEKDSSSIVNATFKFKQPSTAKEFRILGRRFNLNTANGYHQGWGVNEMAKIDVINFPLLLHL